MKNHHHLMEVDPRLTVNKGRNEITNDEYSCLECKKGHKELIYEMESERSMTRTVSDDEYQQQLKRRV